MVPQMLRVESDEPAVAEPPEVTAELMRVAVAGAGREDDVARLCEEPLEMVGREVGECQMPTVEPPVQTADQASESSPTRCAQKPLRGWRKPEPRRGARDADRLDGRHGTTYRRTW